MPKDKEQKDEKQSELTFFKSTPTYEYVLDHYFQIFLASHQLFMRFGRGKIFLLYGHSSAGKTTLCRELVKLKPNWRMDSNDNAFEQRVIAIVRNIDLLKRYFPNKYRKISRYIPDGKIADAIIKGEMPEFKSEASSIRDEIVRECNLVGIFNEACTMFNILSEAEQALFERVVQYSEMGISVVLDTLDFENFHRHLLKNNFHAPLQVSLVFCSFDKISERIIARNSRAFEDKREEDLRFGLAPFFQYATFLKETSKKSPQLKVDTVSKDTISRSITDILLFERKKGIHSMSDKEIEEQSLQASTTLLNELGFTKGQKVVELTPRFPADMVINTGVESIDAGVKKICYKMS